MSYMALYRKFRPRTFSEVKGQDHVVRTLENQIKNGRIGHAYLFTGTRGTGKTSVAKLFARVLNCLNPKDGEPCNECENCRAALKDSFLDIREVDAASNTSVDDVRSIIEEVRYTPVKGKYKVYIIDEVHMLSSSAFNAFLKTLEEPPEYAVFILATTEPHKLPVTILSRCQRYDFHRIENAVIAENLAEITAAENVKAETAALEYIARAGDGSMRDSVSLLDKCITFNLGEALTYENVLKALGAADIDIFSALFRAVNSGDAAAAINRIDEAAMHGRDMTRLVNDFLWYIRNLLLLKVNPETGAEVFGVSKENLEILKEDSTAASGDALMRYIRILSQLLGDLRLSSSGQILTEVAFIKLAKPQTEIDTESLSVRIRQLEGRLDQLETCGMGAAVKEPVQPEKPVRRSAPDIPEAGPQALQDVTQASQVSPGESEEPPAGNETPAEEDAGGPAQQAVSAWSDIVSCCTAPRMRVNLKKAVPAVQDGVLVLYVDESMQMTKEYLEEQKKEIELLVNSVLHDHVAVSVRTADKEPVRNMPAPGASEFPEELLRSINFDIGTEEE